MEPTIQRDVDHWKDHIHAWEAFRVLYTSFYFFIFFVSCTLFMSCNIHLWAVASRIPWLTLSGQSWTSAPGLFLLTASTHILIELCWLEMWESVIYNCHSCAGRKSPSHSLLAKLRCCRYSFFLWAWTTIRKSSTLTRCVTLLVLLSKAILTSPHGKVSASAPISCFLNNPILYFLCKL